MRTHLTVLSHEPDTIVLLSALMDTVLTVLACPSSLCVWVPLATSHTLQLVVRHMGDVKIGPLLLQ